MIKPFKFLSGEKSIFDLYSREINPNHYRTISLTGNLRFLKEYHRRLDCIYMSHYNMFNDRHPLYNQSLELYDRTVGFINGGHITTHEEIRRFVHGAYSDLVYGVFEPWEMGGATNQEILVDTYNFINPRR
jgi:hypothetical protein